MASFRYPEVAGKGYNLRHGAGLEFAQFYECGSIEQFNVWGTRQLEELGKHHLYNHVVQRNFVLHWVAKQCSSTKREQKKICP